MCMVLKMDYNLIIAIHIFKSHSHMFTSSFFLEKYNVIVESFPLYLEIVFYCYLFCLYFEGKMLNIIKHIFIYVCCIYICHAIQNTVYSKKAKKTLLIIVPIVLAILTHILKILYPGFANTFPLIVLWCINEKNMHNPKLSLTTTILAFAISYGTYIISSFILLFAFLPFWHFILFKIPIFMPILAGILQLLLSFFLFRQKRFKKGMPFLSSTKFINFGTFLCLFFLVLLTYIQTANTSHLWTDAFFSFLLVISLAALIFWWQAQLTKSYLHKLQLLELESLRKELEETTKEMEHLKKQNEELGRLIHKDNKLIPALEAAVIDFLSADGVEKNKSLGASLIRQLKELSGSRREILDEVSAARSRHFATGIPALDTLLDYFDRRAEARKMEFTVNIAPNLAAYVPSKISSEDMTHLLADLLENAIIAVAPCASRKIRLQIYPYRKWFVIELSDTGIPFQEKSLLQFGIQQLTTHESSGGSGIGLMDIWKLKEKYHASIHITEYRDTAPFSKRITFLLDHRSQYLIRTWRFEELRTKSRRADLCILPPGDEVSSSEKKEGRHTE